MLSDRIANGVAFEGEMVVRLPSGVRMNFSRKMERFDGVASVASCRVAYSSTGFTLGFSDAANALSKGGK